MKKLNLKSLGIEAGELLTRAQMKNVFGGDGGSTDYSESFCKSTCETNSQCPVDRKCDSGECPDGTKIKACFKY